MLKRHIAFSKISEAHFGCSTARNKGETVCANRLTIRRDALETTVMDGLRKRLVNGAAIFLKSGAAKFPSLAGLGCQPCG